MSAPMEIERKYLIRRPDERALAAIPGCAYTDIEQTYLAVRPGHTDRVRARESGGLCVYTRTVKTRVSDMSNIEREREITRDEYLRLLARADKTRVTIRKRRYALEYAGRVFEIDIYPFWAKQAVMEVELESEGQAVELPPCIDVLRELTGLREYGNAALSFSVPPED